MKSIFLLSASLLLPFISSEQNTLQEKNKMKTVLHKAASRGKADHGWLRSFHTFSFASYRNPDRMHFGVLRVINDDLIQGGTGFGAHDHENMEIISIPLDGAIQHQDNMGNKSVIKKGEIQVMSAGTGVQHSEYNADKNKEAAFLQIWVFPKTGNVTPRYDQKQINPENKRNEFVCILSPDPKGETVWIHQDAWFHVASLDAGKALDYQVKKDGNGLYIFVLEGSVRVGDELLSRRDGMGVSEFNSLSFKANEATELLLMEVPMELPGN